MTPSESYPKKSTDNYLLRPGVENRVQCIVLFCVESPFFLRTFSLRFFFFTFSLFFSRLFSGSAPRLISADLFTLIYHVESGLSRLQYQISFKKLTFFFSCSFFSVRFFFSLLLVSCQNRAALSIFFLSLVFFQPSGGGECLSMGMSVLFFTEVDFQIIFSNF